MPLNRRGRSKLELTAREREVATLIAAGSSNRTIAEHLIIGERAVENHVAAIYNKLKVSSRTALVGHINKEAAIVLRT